MMELADQDQERFSCVEALSPGDMLAERYRLDAVLGEGAMGRVFAATDVHLSRRIALKVPRAPAMLASEMEERLLEEARLAAQLRSGHFASVLDVGRLGTGAPFVTMELLEGESLEKLLERERTLAVAEAVHYVLEACVALAEVHALGIVHRDVKPDNLFLARDLDGTVTVKLLDFGVSSFMLRQHAATQANPVGTPLYMAPEQIESPQDCRVTSDIWSLGAVLYELLIGHPPFDADTIGHVLFKVLTAEPPRPRELRPELPERVEAIVLRCLKRKPSARFRSVIELATALAPFGRPGDGRLATLARRILRRSSERDELRNTMPCPASDEYPIDDGRPSDPLLLLTPVNGRRPARTSGASQHRRPSLLRGRCA